MPVATSSSGRALYDHASTAFVHNMPLEALNTIQSAIQTGQAQSTQQLAEQFWVLQITALCATYTPNDEDQLRSRIEHWQQSSGRDVRLPAEISEQLTLPPDQFFLRLWFHTLAYFHSCPSLKSVKSKAPSRNASMTTISTDTIPPEAVSAALQVPAGVIEALVLGALKIDEDFNRSTLQFNGKFNVHKKGDKKKTVPQGLQSARSICEWILSAYSAISGLEQIIKEERKHLRDQYGRTIRLYALDILAIRLQEWEYSVQMVRCAKLITDDPIELQEREALLAELGEAQNQAETRIDRHQAAKERARRILQQQLEKRKMSASLDDLASQQAQKRTAQSQASNGKLANGNANAKTRTASNQSLPPIERDAGNRDGMDVAKNGSAKASSSRSQSSSPSLERKEADVMKDLNPMLFNESRRSGQVANSNSAIASLRASLRTWLQHFGGMPAFVLALFAVFTISRRIIRFLQGRADRLGPSKRVTSANPNRVALRRPGTSSSRQQQGIISTLWTKLFDTVRMGTQVTYL